MNTVWHAAELAGSWRHRMTFASGVFGPESAALGELLAEAGADPVRVAVFADEAVVDAWPGLADRIGRWARGRRAPAVEIAGPLHAVPGGEAAKNDPAVLERVLGQLAATGLDRHGVVLAVGGGAVLDVVGFAASMAHRGMPLVRLPTTTLAQADAAVGVKNGVNAHGQKNFLGTFAVPLGVIADPGFLETLSPRDWRAGFAEAVKVALLRDPALFGRIERDAAAIAAGDIAAARPVIERSAELHFRHIADGGDPFERGAARPLDFGHWAAHWLEVASAFELRHGEAVAVGLALDAHYAAATGALDAATADRVEAVLRELGFELTHDALADRDGLMRGLEQFRAHLGGALAVPSLRAIGEPVELTAIEPDRVAEAAARLAPGAAAL